MATVIIDGLTYNIPEVGQRNWGQDTTDLLTKLGESALLIKGGSIPLTSEADFGATAGLKSVWFSSRSANAADAGIVRLANLDAINWRNKDNNGNLSLTVDASDKLTFDSSEVLDVDNTATISNKTLDNSNSITVQDVNFTVQDDGDNTKQVKLDVSGVTTATTRTLSVPDQDGTIALVGDIPSVPVDSVFGRTGAVTAQSNDYTWDQIDKTTSDLADITTKSHSSLSDIGTNTHAQIDTHIADVANPHSVTAVQVGLGNVDNTADNDKPVSTAQQAEIDTKQDDVITTRGDIVRGDATGAAERLGIGANGQVLTSDGTDVSWQNPTGGLTDPMTTRGDIIVRDATNTTARLGVGTNGQVLTSDGTDVSWGDIASGSGKNYVVNPDAASDHTTGVTADAGFSVSRTTTAAELPEESKGTAFKINGAGLTAGTSKVAWDILASGIDDADGGRFGRAKVSVLDISGSINGEYSIQVYSVTDSAYVGDEEIITGTGTYYLDVPLVAANDYEFHLKAETASPSNIGLSSVTIEPVSQTWASLGGWKQYTDSEVSFSSTPAGWSLTRAVFVPYKDPVTNVWRLRFNIVAGATGATSIAATISGVSFKTGSFQGVSAYIGTRAGSAQVSSGTGTVTVVTSTSNSDFRVSGDVELDSKPTWADWDNTAPTASDVQYENARIQAEGSANTLASATWTDIVFDTGLRDTTSSFDTSTGVFEAPVDGDYVIVAGWQRNPVASLGTPGIRIQKDTGGGYSTLYTDESTASDTGIRIDRELRLNTGDKIKIQGYHSSGGSQNIDSVNTFIHVTRVPDYSARKASLPFESIYISAATDAYTSADNGSNVLAKTLPAGRYKFTLSGFMNRDATTNCIATMQRAGSTFYPLGGATYANRAHLVCGASGQLGAQTLSFIYDNPSSAEFRLNLSIAGSSAIGSLSWVAETIGNKLEN